MYSTSDEMFSIHETEKVSGTLRPGCAAAQVYTARKLLNIEAD